ncbi:hypothetical protein [Corynebacterium macginleyi]|uniref:hypothetical protein n=1 Tax=Corynebacterium macginleyi TaxID=38290 RepID=UPI001F37AAF9|nr:hypothetical protein [Corynebacterium macginleyi]
MGQYSAASTSPCVTPSGNGELGGIGKQLGSEEFLITGDLPDIEGKARLEKMVDI